MKLKELRQKDNLTQEELSKRISITQFTYSNYEKEKTEPDISTLKLIADYYNVSLDFLCEHKTTNLIDISNLSEERKNFHMLESKLSDKEIINITGYALGLAALRN